MRIGEKWVSHENFVFGPLRKGDEVIIRIMKGETVGFLPVKEDGDTWFLPRPTFISCFSKVYNEVVR